MTIVRKWCPRSDDNGYNFSGFNYVSEFFAAYFRGSIELFHFFKVTVEENIEKVSKYLDTNLFLTKVLDVFYLIFLLCM